MNERLFTLTKGAGPNLVMLHGWGSHHGVWGAFGDALTSSFRVTQVDLPGFGLSQHIQANSIAEFAECILEVVPDSAIYLGWSMGGLLAGYIASVFPQQVKSLVCVASSPCFVSKADWPGMSLKVLSGFHALFKSDYVKSFHRFLALQFLGCETQYSLLAEMKHSITNMKIPDVVTLENSLEIIRTSDLRHQYAALACPQLHIFGSLDMIVPKATAAALQDLNPHANISVIPKAAHIPFLSKKEICLNLIGDFLHAK